MKDFRDDYLDHEDSSYEEPLSSWDLEELLLSDPDISDYELASIVRDYETEDHRVSLIAEHPNADYKTFVTLMEKEFYTALVYGLEAKIKEGRLEFVRQIVASALTEESNLSDLFIAELLSLANLGFLSCFYEDNNDFVIELCEERVTSRLTLTEQERYIRDSINYLRGENFGARTDKLGRPLIYSPAPLHDVLQDIIDATGEIPIQFAHTLLELIPLMSNMTQKAGILSKLYYLGETEEYLKKTLTYENVIQDESGKLLNLARAGLFNKSVSRVSYFFEVLFDGFVLPMILTALTDPTVDRETVFTVEALLTTHSSSRLLHTRSMLRVLYDFRAKGEIINSESVARIAVGACKRHDAELIKKEVCDLFDEYGQQFASFFLILWANRKVELNPYLMDELMKTRDLSVFTFHMNEGLVIPEKHTLELMEKDISYFKDSDEYTMTDNYIIMLKKVTDPELKHQILLLLFEIYTLKTLPKYWYSEVQKTVEAISEHLGFDLNLPYSYRERAILP